MSDARERVLEQALAEELGARSEPSALARRVADAWEAGERGPQLDEVDFEGGPRLLGAPRRRPGAGPRRGWAAAAALLHYVS